jgi:hypothetical protein
MGIARERVTPSQIVTLLALPTEQQEFERQYHDTEGHEYVRDYRTWQNYWHSIGRFLCVKVGELARLGEVVTLNATLDSLASATAAPGVRIVAIMGHWNHGAIELSDGCHLPDQIAQRISPKFDGIVHLCVCNPLEAARFLDRDNDRVLVHFGKQRADPSVWMAYLLVVAKILQTHQSTYLEALEAAKKAMLVSIE